MFQSLLLERGLFSTLETTRLAVLCNLRGMNSFIFECWLAKLNFNPLGQIYLNRVYGAF